MRIWRISCVPVQNYAAWCQRKEVRQTCQRFYITGTWLEAELTSEQTSIPVCYFWKPCKTELNSRLSTQLDEKWRLCLNSVRRWVQLVQAKCQFIRLTCYDYLLDYDNCRSCHSCLSCAHQAGTPASPQTPTVPITRMLQQQSINPTRHFVRYSRVTYI